MRKRTITVLLAGLLAACVLAGCGSNKEPVLEEEGVVNVPAEEKPPVHTPELEKAPEPPKDWLEEHGHRDHAPG